MTKSEYDALTPLQKQEAINRQKESDKIRYEEYIANQNRQNTRRRELIESENAKLKTLYKTAKIARVSFSGGQIQFIGQYKKYIIEQFYIADGEVKKIKALSADKGNMYSTEFWVAYSNGYFYFDIQPEFEYRDLNCYVANNISGNLRSVSKAYTLSESSSWRLGESTEFSNTGNIVVKNIKILIELIDNPQRIIESLENFNFN